MSFSSVERKALKRPDALVQKLNGFFEYLNNNVKALIIGLVAIFLLIVGWILFNNWRGDQELKVSSELYQLEKALQVKPDKSADKVDDKSWETTLQKPIADLEMFIQKHKGSTLGYDAALLLGNFFYDKANYVKAIEYFQTAQAAAKGSVKVGAVLYSLGYAYEGEKRYDDAIQSFEKLIQTKGVGTIKADALLAQARNYILKGDKKSAKEKFIQVTKDFPNTPLAKTAEIEKNKL